MSIDALLPHRPPFRLIDELLEHSADRVLTRACIDADNVFFDAVAGGVPAWTAVEYLAQSAAVWVGLQDSRPVEAGAAEIQPAFLISTRRLESQCSIFPPGAQLRIEVDVNFHDGPIVAFHGKISQCVDGEERQVCEAEFSAFRPDSLQEYLQASDPQHIAQLDLQE